MKKSYKVLLLLSLMGLLLLFTACTKQEVRTIEANQTAFLIPLNGDSNAQASFESEAMLKNAKVAAKQVFITYTRTKMAPFSYEYIPDNMLIIVDRTPVTREWSETSSSGTSTRNQAIYAESSESIGFSVGMNCSAQIYSEDDAVKFLYSYNNKTLDEIMDSEIRARIESLFVERCALETMADILKMKSDIMDYVRDDVVEYFAERGITITVLGMKDGIEYDDPSIQTAINASFVAEREKEAQAVKNETNLANAKADAEAKKVTAEAAAERKIIEAKAEAEANQMIANSITQQLIEKMKYDKWNGQLPKVQGAGNTLITIDDN